jgi:uncharacterized peroxidase-related enzyme
VLNSGYRLSARVLFGMIRMFTRQPLPDAAKINFYRPDFYGDPMKRLTHAAMRGPSSWSVGERELMAAYVSRTNGSVFCVGAHTATAAGALGTQAVVDQTLHDLETAPISEPLRATLRLLGRVTGQSTITPDDIRDVLRAGASAEQVKDALAVCFAFNVINRLADAFDYARLTPEGYAGGARYLLKRGYQ